MAKRDLALDLFKSFKTGAIRSTKKPAPTKNIGATGDPELIGELLTNMIQEREWNSGLAEGNLFVTWAAIVGAEIAQHATPISILDSTLTIQTSSSAWATQLTLVGDSLLQTIQKDPSGATIEKLRFIGPQAPSWKKGIRSIKNARGPRDTYG